MWLVGTGSCAAAQRAPFDAEPLHNICSACWPDCGATILEFEVTRVISTGSLTPRSKYTLLRWSRCGRTTVSAMHPARQLRLVSTHRATRRAARAAWLVRHTYRLTYGEHVQVLILAVCRLLTPGSLHVLATLERLRGLDVSGISGISVQHLTALAPLVHLEHLKPPAKEDHAQVREVVRRIADSSVAPVWPWLLQNDLNVRPYTASFPQLTRWQPTMGEGSNA